MCGIVQNVEYSGFILVNKYLGPSFFCRMTQDVGKLKCRIAQVLPYSVFKILF
jgi:hypothetical protein